MEYLNKKKIRVELSRNQNIQQMHNIQICELS
jgi:hypothetical protein